MRSAWLGLGLTGCLDAAPPSLALECGDVGPDALSGAVESGPTDVVVDGDLYVAGWVAHADGLAVHRVEVAGVPADNDGFNFDAWSVVVPFDVLLGLPPLSGGDVVVDVIVTDTCGVEQTVASFAVAVAR
jgi:hypothetical protein